MHRTTRSNAMQLAQKESSSSTRQQHCSKLRYTKHAKLNSFKQKPKSPNKLIIQSLLESTPSSRCFWSPAKHIAITFHQSSMPPISLAEIKKSMSKTSVIGADVADAEHHPLLARGLPPHPAAAIIGGCVGRRQWPRWFRAGGCGGGIAEGCTQDARARAPRKECGGYRPLEKPRRRRRGGGGGGHRRGRRCEEWPTWKVR